MGARIEDALRRGQLEYLDLRTNRPAMRTRAGPELRFGLREREVYPGLAFGSSGKEKV